VIVVVVSTLCYLHFVPYASTLTDFGMVSLSRRRLGSGILSWVGCDVWLSTSSVSCILGDVSCDVGSGVSWRISCGIGCGVGSRIRSEIDRLHYFIFTSSLFSYWFKGTVATASLAWMF
jgi:hypothetical protein